MIVLPSREIRFSLSSRNNVAMNLDGILHCKICQPRYLGYCYILQLRLWPATKCNIFNQPELRSKFELHRTMQRHTKGWSNQRLQERFSWNVYNRLHSTKRPELYAVSKQFMSWPWDPVRPHDNAAFFWDCRYILSCQNIFQVLYHFIPEHYRTYSSVELGVVAKVAFWLDRRITDLGVGRLPQTVYVFSDMRHGV